MEMVIHYYLLVIVAGVMLFNSVKKYCDTWIKVTAMEYALQQQRR